MTDEGSTRGQGNPDGQREPVHAADDAVDRHGPDRLADLVEPRRAAAGDADPKANAIEPAVDDSHGRGDGIVGRRDGGVTTRLARRCLTAAGILIVVAALCLLVVALMRWDVPSALLTLVSLLAIGGGVIMCRRWAMWRSVARAALPNDHGIPATTADPRPLSPKRAGSPLKRRFGAVVIPLRADSGATPGDGALIVHARADGTAPAAGDRLRVLPIARRGDPIAAGTDPRNAIRALLVRDSDGMVFVATTRVTDTW